jgi:hypothetical protein
MKFPIQPSRRFSHFEIAGLDTLPTVGTQIADRCAMHWETTLRPWLESQECGMPTPETLRNHGTWLIPHFSQHRGLDHKLFRWRGVIAFEGWFDAALGQHIIHPHTPTTPLPWQQKPERWTPEILQS